MPRPTYPARRKGEMAVGQLASWAVFQPAYRSDWGWISALFVYGGIFLAGWALGGTK